MDESDTRRQRANEGNGADVNVSLKVCATGVAVCALLFVAAPPVVAAPKFKSCDSLRQKYPNGVAENRSAARAAIEEGMERPKVSRSIYDANWEKLDGDYDGVICERATVDAATNKIGNLMEEYWCRRAVMEGDVPGPECVKYGYRLLLATKG